MCKACRPNKDVALHVPVCAKGMLGFFVIRCRHLEAWGALYKHVLADGQGSRNACGL